MVWSLVSGTAKGSGGWADGLSYTVYPPHQSLNVFLPARVVQEVARERDSVVGTAVFAAWGVAVNGVCEDVALPSFLEVRCAGAADWMAIHAAMIVVTKPGKRNATSAVKK